MHHSEVDGNKTLLKVVNEIVHVHETREQIEFNDQTPLLEINRSKRWRIRGLVMLPPHPPDMVRLMRGPN